MVLLMFPWLAYTAGLGKLTHSSFLGQPFKAEIELVSVTKDEIPALTARVASPEAFRQAGVIYASYHSSLSISVEKRVNGQPYIQITSPQAVDEPFVSLLIELNGSSGRLLREYTVLLDPVDTQVAEPVNPIIRHTSDQPKTAITTAEVIPPKIKIDQRSKARGAASYKPGMGSTYGPVARGETLIGIARQVTPEGVDLNQMLVALYQANQNGFFRKNINLLKAGVILRIPDQNEISAISQVKASREIGAQTTNWHAYRQKVADAAMGSSSKPKAELKQSATGRISATIQEESSVVKKASPEEVLTLSKGEQLANHQNIENLNEKKSSEAQDYVRMMEEDAIAKDRALKEVNERVALLEQNIERLQRLLEIKSAGMTDTQAQAEQSLAQVAPASTPPGRSETETMLSDSIDLAPTQEINQSEHSEKIVSAQSIIPEQPISQVPLPDSSESIETALSDQIMGFVTDDLELAGGAIAVLLTGWLGISMLRRRRKGSNNMDDDVFDYPGETTKNNIKASPMAELASAEMMILDKVQAARKKDVISEFSQDSKYLESEESKGNLSESVSEFFFGKNLSGSFVNDRNAAPNHECAQIELDPSEGISAEQDPETKFDLENIDKNFSIVSVDRAQDTNEADMLVTKEQSISSHEFAMNLEAEQTDKKDSSYEEKGIPFSIDFPHDLKSSNSMTLLDKGESLSTQDNAQSTKLNLALADIKLDLDDEPEKMTGNGVAHDKDESTPWNEAAVKIDLAQAYLEMEDKEGARKILEEVMREGNEEQQAVARSMVEDLK
ncbi:pilus assembly protein FimV [Nitrosomonas sp. Nm33]|nr:pilus assembly protein FimV [Nitrosomonas sp. Nm33]